MSENCAAKLRNYPNSEKMDDKKGSIRELGRVLIGFKRNFHHAMQCICVSHYIVYISETLARIET